MVRMTAWVETALAGISAALLLATAFFPTWIETVFGVDPDGGDGGLEVLVAVGLVILTITFSVLARVTWRRVRAAT